MKNHDDAISEVMRMAQTPAGQKLIQILQQQGGNALQSSLLKAKEGDTGEIQKILSRLMDDPEARYWIEQLTR